MKLKKMKMLLSEAQANRTTVVLLSDDSNYSFKDIMCNSKYKSLRKLQITQFDTNQNGQLLIMIDDTVLND